MHSFDEKHFRYLLWVIVERLMPPKTDVETLKYTNKNWAALHVCLIHLDYNALNWIFCAISTFDVDFFFFVEKLNFNF